ncbi:hypothetical protein GCM10023336_47880 [Streptomyces similanensis]|uniref:Uncharacterized protein n=1 Tax=Streptomyces similanensis TaxID=1274988 RepID=A0ABP9KVY4_9ACTN
MPLPYGDGFRGRTGDGDGFRGRTGDAGSAEAQSAEPASSRILHHRRAAQPARAR